MIPIIYLTVKGKENIKKMPHTKEHLDRNTNIVRAKTDKNKTRTNKQT